MTLAATQHFLVEWHHGADSDGLYLYAYAGNDKDENDRSTGCTYIGLTFLPGLLNELRSVNSPLTILCRVGYAYKVPGLFKRSQKDGGETGKAYYTPLYVQGHHRAELADALEVACSRENVIHLEETQGSDWHEDVLKGYALEAGELVFAKRYEPSPEELTNTAKFRTSGLPPMFELTPFALERPPKQRTYPPRVYGSGSTILRTASREHRCDKQRCIAGYRVKKGELYVEHRRGSRTGRYHLKCAFRESLIPTNWLNPHFEQYHELRANGFGGWVEQERKSYPACNDATYTVPSEPEAVKQFIQQVEQGIYELDKYDREEWRDHLRQTPFDIEPYRTARRLVGLSMPSGLLEHVGGNNDEKQENE